MNALKEKYRKDVVPALMKELELTARKGISIRLITQLALWITILFFSLAIFSHVRPAQAQSAIRSSEAVIY